MKLSNICINRPVFAAVLNALVILIGLVSYSAIEMRYFPKTTDNVANVKVYYSGASPDLMMQSVTIPLENVLLNVDNVTQMRSKSGYGYSRITLQFTPDTDMTQVMGDIRNSIDSIRGDKLPDDIDEPSVSKGYGVQPALNIAFKDPDKSPAEIRDFIKKNIYPKFQTIPGLGWISIQGASTYAMRIWLDPVRMAGLGVTAGDIKSALKSNNISFSGGSIRGQNRSYSIMSATTLQTPKQFANMIVKQQGSNFVRLKNVATVKLGSYSLQDAPMKINGVNGIQMQIAPSNTANPIDVADQAKQVLDQVKSQLPSTMHASVTYDQSQFLLNSIDESYETLIEAIFLVLLVVFIFLGSIRAALIPIITIPVCVIGVFGIMAAFGASINVVTLLAIILAIGLVVDDAIVVLENIHRHIENGMKPKDAALRGSAEIGFAIIAMTITLVAVYIPLAFTQGFTAVIFQEFAFTLAGAVLISGFVALTLSPMMCAFILSSHQKSTKLSRWVDRVFVHLDAGYQRFLDRILRVRYWVIGGLFILLGIGYVFYHILPQDFIPKEDTGYIESDISTPPSASLDYTQYYMDLLNQDILQKNESIQTNAALIEDGYGHNYLTLKPWGSKRQTSAMQVAQDLYQESQQLPGVKVSYSVPDPVSYGSDSDNSSPVMLYLNSIADPKELANYASEFAQQLSEYPGVENVRNSLKFDDLAYNVSFNRQLAGAFDVSLQQVADTFSMMMSGAKVTNVLSDNSIYRVKVQMNLQDLSAFSGLTKIYVPGKAPDGSQTMIPLSNLVTLTPEVKQSSINRVDKMNTAIVTAYLSPGYSLNQIIEQLPDIKQSVDQKADNDGALRVSIDYGGRLKSFVDSSGTMGILFGLAMIFIYFILAAQFESFVDPFIILLTVPLSLVGALLTLWLTGGTLNLFTNIGLITLVGLISKHGILITQFANQQFTEGVSLFDAVKQGAVTRLRPILMTTSAMVLGSLPLALKIGPGNVANNMVGWTIVGGLIFGTVFSLLIVPVAYVLLSPLDHKKQKILAANKALQAPKED